MPTEEAERELLAGARGLHSEYRSFLISKETGEISARSRGERGFFRPESNRYSINFQGTRPYMSYVQLREEVRRQMAEQYRLAGGDHSHIVTGVTPDPAITTTLTTTDDDALAYFIHEDWYNGDIVIDDDVGVSFTIRDGDGILVNKRELLEISRSNHMTYDLSRTEAEGIYAVTFEEMEEAEETEEPTVTTAPVAPAPDLSELFVRYGRPGYRNESRDRRHYEPFIEIAQEILLPVVKRSIYITVPHDGRVYEPVEDGETFNIWIWTGRKRLRSDHMPARLFGHNVYCAQGGYDVPDNTGLLIVDPETGHHVGEIYGNNLYVFHDMIHDGARQDNLDIFQAILKEATVLLGETEEERAARIAQQARDRQARSKAVFVKMITSSRDRRIADARERVKRTASQIEDYRRALVELIRDIDNDNAIIASLMSSAPDASAVAREFDTLLDHPKVTRIEAVGSTTFHVFTSVLNCRHPRTGDLHEIGAFRIEVNFERATIRWFNLTRQVDGHNRNMQAPHIFESGNPCLGNMEKVMADLLAAYELHAIIMMAISFVEEVNVADVAGMHIDKWPVVEKAPRPDRPEEVPERTDSPRLPADSYLSGTWTATTT